MKIYTTLIATLLVIGLMAPTVSTQTERKIDYTQMVEDIEIMCRIIDKNMKDVFKSEYYYRTGSFRRQGCQGFYLKNYGVIFTLEVQFPVTQKEIPVAPKKKQKADLWQELEREVRHLPHPVDAPPVRTQNKKYDSKKIDKLKERLTHIIGEYSQRIDQLDSDEKISIVVTSKPPSGNIFDTAHRVRVQYRDVHQEEVVTVKPRVVSQYEVGDRFVLRHDGLQAENDGLQIELEAARKKLGTLRKEYDKLRSFPSTTMILTFNENELRDATGSDWKQILASADIVQY